MSKFLQDLQNSAPERKRRWLLGLTLLIMCVVVLVWGSYFDRLVMPAGVEGAPEESPAFTFGETFRAGLSVVWESLFTGIKSIGRIFGASSEYTIKP